MKGLAGSSGPSLSLQFNTGRLLCTTGNSYSISAVQIRYIASISSEAVDSCWEQAITRFDPDDECYRDISTVSSPNERGPGRRTSRSRQKSFFPRSLRVAAAVRGGPLFRTSGAGVGYPALLFFQNLNTIPPEHRTLL